MGCTQAPGPNQAYDLVSAARQNQSPVDIGKLKEAVKRLSANELNTVDTLEAKTALDQAVLLTNAEAACTVLLEAGADPLALCPPREFVSTSLGLAARYETCAQLIPILCKALNADGWKVIREELGIHKSHEVGAVVRVEHKEKGKGTTAWNADKDKDVLGGGTEAGDIIAVDFDKGGGSTIVPRSELKVCRQLSKVAKEQFVASAKAASCEEALVQTLENMEVGHWKPYGVA